MSVNVKCEFCGTWVSPRSLKRHQEQSNECKAAQLAKRLEAEGFVRGRPSFGTGGRYSYGWADYRWSIFDDAIRGFSLKAQTRYRRPGWGHSGYFENEEWYHKNVIALARYLVDEAYAARGGKLDRIRRAMDKLQKLRDKLVLEVKYEVAARLQQLIKKDGRPLTEEAEALLAFLGLGGGGDDRPPTS